MGRVLVGASAERAVQERKRELAQASFERRRPEEQQAARIADVRLLMDV